MIWCELRFFTLNLELGNLNRQKIVFTCTMYTFKNRISERCAFNCLSMYFQTFKWMLFFYLHIIRKCNRTIDAFPSDWLQSFQLDSTSLSMFYCRILSRFICAQEQEVVMESVSECMFKSLNPCTEIYMYFLCISVWTKRTHTDTKCIRAGIHCCAPCDRI